MNTLAGRIDAEGALVDVLVGLNAAAVQTLRQAGRPLVAAVTFRALLDTGSDVCCVDPQVIGPLAGLGLRPLRYVLADIPTLGVLKVGGMYAVSLTIVHPSGIGRANLVLRNQEVLEQLIGQLGYQVLIGRDLLRRCLFMWDGPGEAFTLGY